MWPVVLAPLYLPSGILCITSDPAHNLSESGENRCKVSKKKLQLMTFSDCTYLSGVSTWAVKITLVVLGCKGDYNTLRYQQKMKYVNKDQRSRQYATKLICIHICTYIFGCILWQQLWKVNIFVKIPKSWIVRASWGLHPKPSSQVDG